MAESIALSPELMDTLFVIGLVTGSLTFTVTEACDSPH